MGKAGAHDHFGTGQRIMIRDGDGRKPALAGARDNLGRSQRTVGGRGMNVKIDIHIGTTTQALFPGPLPWFCIRCIGS